ncbi:glycosyl hydrolase family 18 protein [Timonella senegalensis]|uniref:glycosyl hydrolase family 18 protein n=1 Tax=Timonella senegalensis TaxID=1465825 RepID=UPI002FDDC43F
MKNKLRAAAVVAAMGFVAVFPALTALPASAHGWVTDPPSRQANCAAGATPFDCGSVKYEPQSVEAPKGSMKCSGGNAQFSILDDNSKAWPVKNIGSSINIQWKLTAAHNTSLWEYFVDGKLHQTFDQGGAQPSPTINHTLTNLPSGKHTILARWNVSNTGNAFYNCMDVNVGGSTGGTTHGGTTDGGTTNGGSTAGGTAGGSTNGGAEDCPAAYVSTKVYNGGDLVSHNGDIWRAKWWTQGQAPGTTGQWGQWENLGPCSPAGTTDGGTTDGGTTDGGTTDAGSTDGGTTDGTVPEVPGNGTEKVVGYFTNWGVYQRNYHVKNIKTSGSADKLTHILYAFGNVQNGKCTIGDAYADYEKSYTADQSVDGVADKWDQPLRGNFNQLRKLKAQYPDLKVIWSFGGWTWSGGFSAAAANPEAFAKSCRDLVEDPRWADLFDGIDIDWEYPNECGLTCDTSGYESYPRLLKALRAQFGNDLVTSAIAADGTTGGKIDAANYAEGAKYLDWIMPMTYDYFGAWKKEGPTAPHSPLEGYGGIPIQGFDTKTTISKLKSIGVPANKILLGIGFYGKGWTGVTQAAPGGSATGAAPATYEAGVEDYKVLKTTCPATGKVGGTSYGFCNGNWWSYDTPSDIVNKMNYAQAEGLSGAFFWELSGDTANGELISAITTGLQ